MSFLGSALSSLGKLAGDLGGSLLTSAYTNKLNKNASEHAFKNQLYGSKELARYQAYDLPEIAMAGYKKAGINPIIAYGGLGSSSMPTMSVSAARQEGPDFGAVFSRATARRELDLREKIADQEQKRADKLAAARIADMAEARRLQEKGINSSGITGLLKFIFGDDKAGKVGESISKAAEAIFDSAYGNSAEHHKSWLQRLVDFHKKAAELNRQRRQEAEEKDRLKRQHLLEAILPRWYSGYDWNSADARKRARMRRYEQDRKELKK